MKKKNKEDFLNDLRLWTKFKNGMCDTCIGLCCYMPVEVTLEDLFRLEILPPFFKDFSARENIKEAKKHPSIERYKESTEKFTLARKFSGACIYLNDEGRCTVYSQRPETCRNHPKIGPKPGHCAYYPKPSSYHNAN